MAKSRKRPDSGKPPPQALDAAGGEALIGQFARPLDGDGASTTLIASVRLEATCKSAPKWDPKANLGQLLEITVGNPPKRDFR
jgi:hypothetical protein